MSGTSRRMSLVGIQSSFQGPSRDPIGSPIRDAASVPAMQDLPVRFARRRPPRSIALIGSERSGWSLCRRLVAGRGFFVNRLPSHNQLSRAQGAALVGISMAGRRRHSIQRRVAVNLFWSIPCFFWLRILFAFASVALARDGRLAATAMPLHCGGAPAGHFCHRSAGGAFYVSASPLSSFRHHLVAFFLSGHSARKKERTQGEALTRRWCIVGRRGAPSSSLGFSHPGRPKGTLPTLRDVGASAGPAAGGGSLDPDPHHVKHSQRYFFGAAPGGGENAKSAEDLDPPRFRAPPVMVGPRAAPGSRGHWRSTTSRP